MDTLPSVFRFGGPLAFPHAGDLRIFAQELRFIVLVQQHSDARFCEFVSIYVRS